MPSESQFAQEILAHVRLQPGTEQLWRAVSEALCSRGIPLHQTSAHLRILHPRYQGLSYVWRLGSATATEVAHLHDEQPRKDFFGMPVGVLAGADAKIQEWRAKLAGPNNLEVLRAFPGLSALQRDGVADHFALRFEYTTGRANAVSFSARAPGFSDAEIALIRALREPLAGLLELHAYKGLARRLLDTYVGESIRGEILGGGIRRGYGRSLRAVIWFCDIRGYTSLSTLLPSATVIQLLNDFFDVMAAGIRSCGGEILKFIGDAMLAVVVTEGMDETTLVERVVAGAIEARQRMAVLNIRRASEQLPTIDYGIALHLGEVTYGNIGAEDRLDFTVVGPAVNIASRISGLCRTVNQHILVSAAVRDAIQGDLQAMGRHDLRGVGEIEVFGIPDSGEAGR